MVIGGLIKQTLTDFPGKLAAIVFTQGCNFRCPYCHNPDLVLPECFDRVQPITEKAFFSFLCRNKGLVEGVVVTGGEPTVQKDLPEFIERLKTMGLAVKLDTNGTNYKRLESLLERKLLDYVAMDLKAPLILEDYQRIAGVRLSPNMMANILESKDLLLQQNIPYEFRSTLIRECHEPEDVVNIAEEIEGARLYCLQQYAPEDALNVDFRKFTPYTIEEMNSFAGLICDKVNQVLVR
ncbi:anaerobic ribonucleoside-triphosphate reductase activating protein [Rapidithrix thailandica]|uniref:Anaerobic ribonucleoside-triphosphate reductase activating protein n=1 Tax=Rapidithrix thailandica TaxID=413964 RepID=A0AAW9RZH4_9BACT